MDGILLKYMDTNNTTNYRANHIFHRHTHTHIFTWKNMFIGLDVDLELSEFSLCLLGQLYKRCPKRSGFLHVMHSLSVTWPTVIESGEKKKTKLQKCAKAQSILYYYSCIHVVIHSAAEVYICFKLTQLKKHKTLLISLYAKTSVLVLMLQNWNLTIRNQMVIWWYGQTFYGNFYGSGLITVCLLSLPLTFSILEQQEEI